MQRITILHTNDIHGRIEGLARVGTLVAQIRSEGSPVLFLDAGDSEEYANRLSSLTKGIAMHRLLAAAGCQVVAVGNAILSRYGPKVVTEETIASAYPHLAANICYADGRTIPGIRPSMFVDVAGLRLGIIGLTARPIDNNYEKFFGLKVLPTVPVIREQVTMLRGQGAQAILLLSHLGLKEDREIAAELQEEVPLILGGHSHNLLPDGERVGDVWIAQAGQYAEHLGRVELEWDGRRLLPLAASVIPVVESIPPSAEVQSLADQIEREVQERLDEVICQLPAPLDYAVDRECGIGNLLADALRTRARADVAVAVPGVQFIGGLSAGPLRRETLWSACPSTGNPGVVDMTGAQLTALIRRGQDLEFAADKHPAMRGQARGLVHISGVEVSNGQFLVDGSPVAPGRTYLVAATDFELEPFWGYTQESWQLKPTYEVDVILREVLDDYLSAVESTAVEMGRLGT